MGDERVFLKLKFPRWTVALRCCGLLAVLAAVCCLAFTGRRQFSAAAASNNVVISQVYGGGGGSTGTYLFDYVELFNRGTNAVNITGWSIQYGSATGTAWSKTLLSGTLQPGQYYLIQQSNAGSVGLPLPTPDAIGTLLLSATNGKVALVNADVALTGACPVDASIIDLVGYGVVNCAENLAVGPLTSTSAALRNDAGCSETDNNAADFTVSLPTPRNSSAALNLCNGPPVGNLHLTLGNPSGATEDVAQENNYLMLKPQYVLSYSRNLAEPNWVSWQLDTSWLGGIDRQDDYRPDPAVPSDWYAVQANDYAGSGFDRGHLCPSADRTNSVATNSSTFLMTNFIPQAPNNNRGPWADLEGVARTIAQAGNELYIISGGAGALGKLPANCAPPGHCINIPAQTWKVMLALPVGSNDVSRVNTGTRAIAVIMPNTQAVNPTWQTYLTSVDAVEALTGFDFFSNVPVAIQNVIESRVDGVTPASTIQFSGLTYTVNEGAANAVGSSVANITVSRTGNLTTPAAVEYALKEGTAQQRADYVISSGLLNFAAGEASKTIQAIIIDDNYTEGDETINLELNNVSGAAFATPNRAVLTITDNDTGAPTLNPINGNLFFVRQSYHDFLGRIPDQAGLDFWTGQLNSQCGVDPACNARRIGVSAAFFVELEFQQTGFVVYKLNRAAYGLRPVPEQTRVLVPYEQFMGDRSQLIGGAQLPASTQAFIDRFVLRREFLAKYPATLTNAQYVNTLFDTAGLTNGAFANERQAQIDAMNTQGRTRAQVLLNLINLQFLSDREFNPSFVLMQYFGYLRRDPDQGGYDFWLNILNQQSANARGMVCAFITSDEYQQRFSSVVTRTNALCNGNP